MRIVLHSLHNVSEEREGEEVVGHVSRVKHESAIGAALLSGCQGDFTVLHHLIAAVHLTDNAHRLRGIGLLHHLENQKTCKEPALLKLIKSVRLNICFEYAEKETLLMVLLHLILTLLFHPTSRRNEPSPHLWVCNDRAQSR